jgi:hypothetical protein
LAPRNQLTFSCRRNITITAMELHSILISVSGLVYLVSLINSKKQIKIRSTQANKKKIHTSPITVTAEFYSK